jgi:major membrane immunogen (membrane-anchored lipoprotein)
MVNRTILLRLTAVAAVVVLALFLLTSCSSSTTDVTGNIAGHVLANGSGAAEDTVTVAPVGNSASLEQMRAIDLTVQPTADGSSWTWSKNAGDDGSFSFQLPPGAYTVSALDINPSGIPQKKTVTVRANKTTTVDFDFKVHQLPRE